MLDDTKGVIRNRKLTKDKQYNGQEKKNQRTNNVLQTQYRKVKIEQHNKGNNKITELRTILQRESQNSLLYKQTKSVNSRKTVKTNVVYLGDIQNYSLF